MNFKRIVRMMIVLAILCFANVFAMGTADMVLVPGSHHSAVKLESECSNWFESESGVYSELPLTVEARVKIDSSHNWNILMSNAPKASATHWEIYTYIGSGIYSVYLPGYEPSEVSSGVNIADSKWHYVGMSLDGKTVRLYVDSELVKEEAVVRKSDLAVTDGPLRVGAVIENGYSYGFDGAIEEIKISSKKNIAHFDLDKPLKVDADTIALWNFEKGCEDLSGNSNNLVFKEIPKVSLDEIERETYKAGSKPTDIKPVAIELVKEKGRFKKTDFPFMLNGTWKMAEGGEDASRLQSDWSDEISAAVPGSVHTALFNSGLIPDPRVGKNQKIANKHSFKTWWFKKTFDRPLNIQNPELVLEGVAVKCMVWLNGELLGEHDGMFAPLRYDVAGKLKDTNTLIVKIFPAPFLTNDTSLGGYWKDLNTGWTKTVVFNNVYGWHYSNIPAIGIWRPVKIQQQRDVKIEKAFVVTKNIDTGKVSLVVDLAGALVGWKGELAGSVLPDNFSGDEYCFNRIVTSDAAKKKIHLQFNIPDHKLWWPNDLGEQNLYTLNLALKCEGAPEVTKKITFGLRTIEMKPFPYGPDKDKYSWTFVVNGREIFVKGTNWCTMDPLMDFSRERYDEFLSLAKSQHVQLLRAWGAGMPETDDFYDLCDRKGLMVWQEWPTAWDSHKFQPYDLLEETVEYNTLRLRNHPSLVLYAGGNESGYPYGKVIDMMGRKSVEMDGTRAFHRTQPFGGSIHNYGCYWGRAELDNNLKLKAEFIGEFGLASYPLYESVMRFLPEDEKDVWPVGDDSSFAYHSPKFNTVSDFEILSQYAHYFVPQDCDMNEFIVGSQLSQAVGLRHPLEKFRTCWPNSTGAVYYKLNDNYPAASWASVDWYGAPKLSYYFVQDSFSPLLACAVFDTVKSYGKTIELPIYVLDDFDALNGSEWKVNVKAYDEKLNAVKTASYYGGGTVDRVLEVGKFYLSERETKTSPLFVVLEIHANDELMMRTFYFVNYEHEKGSLFNLPRTKLTLKKRGSKMIVKNVGSLPAVAVYLECPNKMDRFRVDDGYFWLEAGEEKLLEVNMTRNVRVRAWNSEF